MAQSKATKKFEKNRLKGTLDRRKEFKKIKQRHQVRDKKKAKRAAENEDDADDDDAATNGTGNDTKKQDALSTMSVDDFFAGGFEVPEKAAKKKKRAGKRKRTQDQADEDSDASVASIEEHAAHESDEDEIEGGDLEAHKDELKALAEKDPEFYKFLQDEDPELLDAAEQSNLMDVDELSEGEEDDTSKQAQKSSLEVTKSMIKQWTTAIQEKQSLRATRDVVLAFRAAAHMDEEDDKKVYKYSISNADVYHELLLTALKQVPAALNHHLPVKELSNGKVRVSTDNSKFKKLSTLLKSHGVSILHLLQNLSDPATIKLTLNSVLSLLPYLLPFRKLLKEITEATVEVWADAAQSEATRVTGFLILRRLTTIADAGLTEMVLRTAYKGLVKGSRSTTVYNISGHNLMKNSAAELWGLAEPTVAYTTGFQFIRQLAIHLRNSIKHNANDAYKTVYNWQYVHSLDFWSRVLAMHCDTLREATKGRESPLRPLLYPFTQVTLGALRLIPTAAYFALRFHLVRALIRMSQTTNTFVPLATPLYEVLQSSEMRKPPKPSTLKAFDFDVNIRAPKQYLHTRVYQDGVGEQVVELLSEFFVLWCKSIAFPELALPVTVMLRRWLKDVSPFNAHNKPPARGKQGKSGKKQGDAAAGGNRNSKINSAVSLLVAKLDANAKWIEERRAKVEFAPNNRAGVEGFLKETEWTKTPLGAFVEGQRKAREEKRRMLAEAREEEERQREEEKQSRAGRDEEDEGEDDDLDAGSDEGDGALDEEMVEDEDESEEELEEDVEMEDEEE